METAELELFSASIRRATETGGGESLDAALDELGWRDALVADRSSAVSLLFEAQGWAVADSSALDWLLAAGLGEEDTGAAAVVLPPIRRAEAPARVAGGRCEVRGLGTKALARQDTAVVVAETDAGPVALTVKVSALELRPVRGLDPGLGLVEVTADLDAGATRPVDWAQAASLGQLALGHELVGLARAMLELARRHALDRVQFGRPISSFQAVRHRLAESLVALEAADGLLSAAWDDPSPVTAAMAKGLAGRSARTVARHAQQVLAGIGFTAEHPLHRSVRRTILLDQLLGASSVLTAQLGANVLEHATLPPTFPL
jgi:alkylation response protein AidB-like acyl-CoA dehydrogenase